MDITDAICKIKELAAPYNPKDYSVYSATYENTFRLSLEFKIIETEIKRLIFNETTRRVLGEKIYTNLLDSDNDEVSSTT